MAWQDEMTLVLRTMVWDLSTTQQYTDDSLQQVIVSAAQLMMTEVPPFTKPFVPDVINVNIVPDPTNTAGNTRDNNFINLTLLKAAAIIDQGVVRTQSGIVIRDNGSMVDLRDKLKSALALLSTGWAKTYQQEKLKYAAGLLTGNPAGHAVLSSFRDMARSFYPGDGLDWCMETDLNPRSGNYYW